MDGLRRVLGRDKPNTGVAIYGLANCLKAQGRLEEAEGLARELVSDFPESSRYYPAFASLLQEMLSLRAAAEGGEGGGAG